MLYRLVPPSAAYPGRRRQESAFHLHRALRNGELLHGLLLTWLENRRHGLESSQTPRADGAQTILLFGIVGRRPALTLATELLPRHWDGLLLLSESLVQPERNRSGVYQHIGVCAGGQSQVAQPPVTHFFLRVTTFPPALMSPAFRAVRSRSVSRLSMSFFFCLFITIPITG